MLNLINTYFIYSKENENKNSKTSSESQVNTKSNTKSDKKDSNIKSSTKSDKKDTLPQETPEQIEAKKQEELAQNQYNELLNIFSFIDFEKTKKHEIEINDKIYYLNNVDNINEFLLKFFQLITPFHHDKEFQIKVTIFDIFNGFISTSANNISFNKFFEINNINTNIEYFKEVNIYKKQDQRPIIKLMLNDNNINNPIIHDLINAFNKQFENINENHTLMKELPINYKELNNILHFIVTKFNQYNDINHICINGQKIDYNKIKKNILDNFLFPIILSIFSYEISNSIFQK